MRLSYFFFDRSHRTPTRLRSNIQDLKNGLIAINSRTASVDPKSVQAQLRHSRYWGPTMAICSRYGPEAQQRAVLHPMAMLEERKKASNSQK